MLESETGYNYYILKNIIIRIEYSPILKLFNINKESAEDFRKLVFSEFPNFNFKIKHDSHIEFDPYSGFPGDRSSTDSIIWTFSSEDDLKIINLNANYLEIHYKDDSYKDWKCLVKDISLILYSLEVYKPFKIKHVSLRRIIQFEDCSASNLKEYFNFNFSKDFVKILKENKNLIQVFHNLDFKKDEYLLNIKYGLFNPEFPNPEASKDFIVDLKAILINCNSFKDLKKHLEKMNFIINEQFEEFTTDKLRKLMN